MPTDHLKTRMQLARRYKIDGSPGDAVLLEFLPDLADPQLRQWAAIESTGTGSTSIGGSEAAQFPVTLQVRMQAEVAKEAFRVGEAYTLTIERAGRGT